MIKISILLAFSVFVTTSLIFASMSYDAIYGQKNQSTSLTPQPIRPDQQAAQAQQQAAQAQQQAAQSQPQSTNQTSAQPQSTNQTSAQPQSTNQTSAQPQSTNQTSGKLNVKSLLNYTNHAVLALHGKHLSSSKQKIAEDNLLKIQEMLIKNSPGKSLILKPQSILP
ncbi:MAG TPA: hypothetical protein VIY08_07030 [Candidatus Nitrosocosmicus sp.]